MEDLKQVFFNDLKECEAVVDKMTNENYVTSMGLIKKRLDLILSTGDKYNQYIKASNAWIYTMTFTKTRLKNKRASD